MIVNEVPKTWVRIGAIIWVVVWRGVVGGAILGALGGLAVGIIAAVAGIPGPHPMAAGLSGLALSIPWYFVVFRMALKKQYRDFRIALIVD